MPSPRWMHSPVRDAALALCWLPFAAVVIWYQHDPHALRTLLDAVLLLSLSHQPITLALVYGDTARLKEHRRIFSAGPIVALVVVALALHASFALVAIAAALWNAEHTLMQRYGVTRMYGRKAGDDRGALEKPMLFSWLALAAVAAAASPATAHYLAEVNLGDVNKRAISLLVDLRPEAIVLLVPALFAAGVLTARWIRAEAADSQANPAKWLYVGATAALIVVLCIDPVAGFAAYVGAHAIEYFVIVRGAVARRADAGEGGVVGAAVRAGLRGAGFVAAVAIGAVIPLVVLDHVGTFTIVTTVYLTVGALHIFYDGLIWKQRQPAVARDLAVAAAVSLVPAGSGSEVC